jgi:hypothetical protein
MQGGPSMGRAAIEAMDALNTVCRRFTTQEEAVRRRYTADQEFRAICDEYVLARRALAHWNAVDPPCQQREQEYWRLVRELEDEIVAALVGRP